MGKKAEQNRLTTGIDGVQLEHSTVYDDSVRPYYSIGKVAKLIGVPVHTLLYWEMQFPMFSPGRTPKGTRRFTVDDLNMARYIKELLHDKGLRIEAAVEIVKKNYRKCPPHRPRKCVTPSDAVALLGEVRLELFDANSLSKLDAVVGYLNSLPTP